MFRSIFQSLAICFQGTFFESRHKQKGKGPEVATAWTIDLEAPSKSHPYLLVQDEYKVKSDLISRLHGVDNRLLDRRSEAKKGKAKWCPHIYEQRYDGPDQQNGLDGRVEVYTKSLGLAQPKESASNW